MSDPVSLFDPSKDKRAGTAVVLPFLLRRMKVSLSPRDGAAEAVPWAPAAFAAGEAAVTWVGHASFLVRMDGAAFATDPIFSRRCSPVQFMGPPRLVPPGVPLDGLPRLDFALLSHDHYDHTDRATVRALGARGVPFVVPRGMGALVRAFGAPARPASCPSCCGG